MHLDVVLWQSVFQKNVRAPVKLPFYLQGVSKKKEPPPPIKDDIPWSLPSYVVKESVKIVYFYTFTAACQLDTCFNKNGDSKSQIRKLHVV